MTLKLASARFWCAAVIPAFVLGVCPAAAQEAGSPGAEQTSPSGGKAKTEKKAAKTNGKSAKSAKSEQDEPKIRKFSSEADAKRKCPGAVVWVDKHQINHYEGARQYGVKPGAFACEP